MKTLKELQEQLKKFLTEARGLCDLVDKETRDFTEDERTKVAGLMEEARKTKTEIQKFQSDEAMRKQILDLGADLEAISASGEPDQARKGKTLGQRFTEDQAWQAWMKQVAPGGIIQIGRASCRERV